LTYKGLIKGEFPSIRFQVTSSKGMYVRALARDIGERLGYPSYCTALVRSAIGPITLHNAVEVTTKESIDRAKFLY
jgi:tRNA pseudouridine55 synthase